jgi:hypothetical protein
MSGAVTGAWQMNLTDYPNHRFQTLHMPIPRSDAFSFKFRTPTQAYVDALRDAGNAPVDFNAGFSKADTSIWTTRAAFMSVTPVRCDFDYVKNDAPNGCYKGHSNNDQNVAIRVLRSGSPSTSTATTCDLSPDTEYYVNFRWEFAGSPPYSSSTANRGLNSCVDGNNQPLPTCGFVLRFD